MTEAVPVVPAFRVAPADAIDFGAVRRALVVKLRHHGDVLLTSPVFSVLKRHHPQMEVDALVYADTAPMIAHHPDIAQVHTIGRDWKRQGAVAQLSAEWALWKTLRARRYDLLIVLSDHRRGQTLARWLGVRWSVAPKTGKSGWAKAFTHAYPVARGNTRHTVDYHLDALRRLGLQPEPAERKLVLHPGEAAEQHVSTLLHQHGLMPRGFLHVHAPSRWLFKTWPVDAMADLIDRLTADRWPVVLTGAPSDMEREMNAAILAQLKPGPNANRVIDLTGQLSLPQLAALTGRARLFIGVDSAPMHMAAAMGTPTVALFGPSGDIEWAPWMVPSRVLVSREHACRPCGYDGCGGGKVSDCLRVLQPDAVHLAARELLEQTA